jgi:molecular chaperone HscA
MALLQIAEPGQSSVPHQHRLAAGIDLGTTNSLVATVRSGMPTVIQDENGLRMMPSVVRYLPCGNKVVGTDAKKALASDPHNTIASVKRLMGRGVADIEGLQSILPYELSASQSGMPLIKTVAGDKSPVEVSAEILKELAREAKEAVGGELDGVVITVPAYFDDAQRQATKSAASLAGLKVLRLLNEPTAAAMAYGLDAKQEGIFAVYDLGGGTFDISILSYEKGVFQVLATGGDSSLGGDDFDLAIAKWVIEQGQLELVNDKRLYRTITEASRNAKELLATQESADIKIELDGNSQWQGQLSRTQFESLVAPIIKRTILACRRCIKDADIELEQIDEVVMVGGSTRTLAVRSSVESFFNTTPLTSIDPDTVVALGASIQADILVGNKPDSEAVLLDVVPLSLGIETMGGLTEKIVSRNSTIPVSRAQEFTTFKDGQTAMSIHVLQGERELVADCRSLARFTLRGIPPMVAGAARIRVTFTIDADGLLQVAAEETITHTKAEIDVKPSFGLSDQEIAKMLTDSISFAEDDIHMRNLREQQVEAARVVEDLNYALQEHGEQLLTTEQQQSITALLEKLKDAAQGAHLDKIKSLIKTLDHETQDFAAKRMNLSIQKALVGHNVQEV